MIEIILGLARMDKGQTPDHLIWRDAVGDLVRKTETLIGLLSQRSVHHRLFAQRVKQALVRQRGKASVLSASTSLTRLRPVS